MLVRGRIRRYGTLESSLNLLIEGVVVLPITPEIATLAAQFPRDYSGDPADRIGGTARAEGLTLITHHERIRRSPLLRACKKNPIVQIHATQRGCPTGV
jgi:PIN domain nuclease of toxin-antitoxin system